MTGLGERVATSALSTLLRRGFLASDTPYGDVRFAVPRHALRFYFPALWPEAEQDQALLQAELKVSGTARADLTTAPKTLSSLAPRQNVLGFSSTLSFAACAPDRAQPWRRLVQTCT